MPSTETMAELELGMSNFDGSIDTGLAEALKEKPGQVFGRHAGWNFNGRVYFHGGKFHEEVWVYGSPRATFSADNLRDLMEDVCSEYGRD